MSVIPFLINTLTAILANMDFNILVCFITFWVLFSLFKCCCLIQLYVLVAYHSHWQNLLVKDVSPSGIYIETEI